MSNMFTNYMSGTIKIINNYYVLLIYCGELFYHPIVEMQTKCTMVWKMHCSHYEKIFSTMPLRLREATKKKFIP